jgi:hypothetical protein
MTTRSNETLEEQQARVLDWWIKTRTPEFWRLMKKATNILTRSTFYKEQNKNDDVH